MKSVKRYYLIIASLSINPSKQQFSEQVTRTNRKQRENHEGIIQVRSIDVCENYKRVLLNYRFIKY